MKYITTQDEDECLEIFVFPRSINHDAMAEVLEDTNNEFHRPISAGFVSLALNCHGSSATLNLNSTSTDTELLRSQYVGEQMKFITTVDDNGREELFLFPRNINHDAMAEVIQYIKDQTHGNWRRVPRKPISAGFVASDNTCYGHSETLGLKSRPEDTKLLVEQSVNL